MRVIRIGYDTYIKPPSYEEVGDIARLLAKCERVDVEYISPNYVAVSSTELEFTVQPLQWKEEEILDDDTPAS